MCIFNLIDYRGLGASIATSFAAEGSHISINYVSNKSAADTLAETLGKQYGAKCCVIQGVSAIIPLSLITLTFIGRML